MVTKLKQYTLPSSSITDESVFLNRRHFLKSAAAVTTAPLLAATSSGLSVSKDIQRYDGSVNHTQKAPEWLAEKIRGARPGEFSTSEKLTPYEYVTRYNNFYEFGSDKGDPAENSTEFRSDPWHIEVTGAAHKTGKYNLEDILKPHGLEERIYRLRCVEAWSMVVPWIGFPLADLIKRFEPTMDAKFVRFETIFDPKQMSGQRSRFTSIDYPYVEGLRMDEAMNELAFIAVGVYGNSLPPQNGAPLRLVVPWKYGFKSIKSIAKISFSKQRPRTTWELTNSREYGFYANVNPEVNHPRWSQGSERRLPSSLFSPNRIDTRKFNGYEAEVAHLYAGMNLKRNF